MRLQEKDDLKCYFFIADHPPFVTRGMSFYSFKQFFLNFRWPRPMEVKGLIFE
jgi:hypothetical protein